MRFWAHLQSPPVKPNARPGSAAGLPRLPRWSATCATGSSSSRATTPSPTSRSTPTHAAPEGGFDLGGYPAVKEWLTPRRCSTTAHPDYRLTRCSVSADIGSLRTLLARITGRLIGLPHSSGPALRAAIGGAGVDDLGERHDERRGLSDGMVSGEIRGGSRFRSPMNLAERGFLAARMRLMAALVSVLRGPAGLLNVANMAAIRRVSVYPPGRRTA